MAYPQFGYPTAASSLASTQVRKFCIACEKKVTICNFLLKSTSDLDSSTSRGHVYRVGFIMCVSLTTFMSYQSYSLWHVQGPPGTYCGSLTIGPTYDTMS